MNKTKDSALDTASQPVGHRVSHRVSRTSRVSVLPPP